MKTGRGAVAGSHHHNLLLLADQSLTQLLRVRNERLKYLAALLPLERFDDAPHEVSGRARNNGQLRMST